MKDNVLKEKTLKLAIRIVKLYKYLMNEKSEIILNKQLLRCGTSIGANCREADYAESKSDFIHKLSIAQKECNETLYWLELLKETNYITENEFNSINTDATEIMKLLTSSILTTKKHNNVKIEKRR